MKALIDADVLVYEIGFSGQVIDKDTGELEIMGFDFVSDLLDQRIKEIEAEVWATEPSLLFLTGDKKINKILNKEKIRLGEEEIELKPNFRIETAKTKVYKGTRKQQKPYHYDNIRAYMLATYPCVVADGMEADDVMAMYLYDSHVSGKLDVICCTRDKDLRMVPGLHFGWQCGKQLQFGPKRVTELGEIELKKSGKKIEGTGMKFFYSQLLTGDKVDNIPGLPKFGPVKAYKLLNGCNSELELYNVVKEEYQKFHGDIWKESLREQADLLWMVRELDEDGNPVKYKFPED